MARTVLVTGATGGIGSATCRVLAAEGASVVVSDLASRAPEGQKLADELGGGAEFVELDVTSESSWSAATATVSAARGRLDALVNNAGIILMKPIEETTLDDWRRINAVNVEGVFLGTRACIGLLTEGAKHSEHGSAIVNLSSIYGIGGQPGFAAYCASKGAVRLLTKATALEFAQRKLRIRVNSVHPGPIDTDLARAPMKELLAGQDVDVDAALRAAMDQIGAQYPGGRIGLPEDVAGVVAFLASDASRFMNGAELAVDDGFTAKAQ